jgi:hypothetical protein
MYNVEQYKQTTAGMTFIGSLCATSVLLCVKLYVCIYTVQYA